MNKLLLSAALVAGFGVAALAPRTASAVDGQITFAGKVTSSTCTVNAANGASFTVTLPTVGAAALGTTAGTVAGATPFSIALTACSATGTVKAYFEPGSTINANGRLNNTISATSGVDLQLLNDSRTAINLNTQANTTTATIATNAATLNYYVQYYNNSAAAVTAGLVASTVNYTIQYQ
jgi:major type 1 subunit fimbrin (pilin)